MLQVVAVVIPVAISSTPQGQILIYNQFTGIIQGFANHTWQEFIMHLLCTGIQSYKATRCLRF